MSSKPSKRRVIEIRHKDGRLFKAIDCAYMQEETRQNINGYCVYSQNIGQESTSYTGKCLFIALTDTAEVKYSE